MKNQILFCFLLILASPCFLLADSVSEINKTTSFRGFKFGDPVSKYPNLVKIDTDEYAPDIECYRPDGSDTPESRAIGDAAVDVIDYLVYKGKIYCVRIISKDKWNMETLRTLFYAKFGKPYYDSAESDNSEEAGTIYWKGAKLRVTFVYNTDYTERTVTTEINYFWVPISDVITKKREAEDIKKKNEEKQKASELLD